MPKYTLSVFDDKHTGDLPAHIAWFNLEPAWFLTINCVRCVPFSGGPPTTPTQAENLIPSTESGKRLLGPRVIPIKRIDPFAAPNVKKSVFSALV